MTGTGTYTPPGRIETSQTPFTVLASGVDYNTALAHPTPVPATVAAPVPVSVPASGLFVFPADALNIAEFLPFGTDAEDRTFTLWLGVFHAVVGMGKAPHQTDRWVPQVLAKLTVTLGAIDEIGGANNLAAKAITVDNDYSLSPGTRVVGDLVKSVILDTKGSPYPFAQLTRNGGDAATCGVAVRMI